MAVVYRHIRLDKNEPFYIGIGQNRRAYAKNGRNQIWHRIVAKTEYDVEILFDDVSWDFAVEKEREFISLYGRMDNKTGILANMTDGGEGIVNHKHSEQTKSKMRKARLGIVFSEEHIKNLSDAHRGKCPSNAKKVKNIETGKNYRSLRFACAVEGLNYKTEHVRMKRNPDSSKNKFIYTQ